MNDRELLEMAAKAAGIAWTEHNDEYGLVLSKANMGHELLIWNPLTDDGDALRLAVNLSLHVKVCRRSTLVEKRELGDDVVEAHGSDANAATRRAITRAAAEIGRSLP